MTTPIPDEERARPTIEMIEDAVHLAARLDARIRWINARAQRLIQRETEAVLAWADREIGHDANRLAVVTESIRDMATDYVSDKRVKSISTAHGEIRTRTAEHIEWPTNTEVWMKDLDAMGLSAYVVPATTKVVPARPDLVKLRKAAFAMDGTLAVPVPKLDLQTGEMVTATVEVPGVVVEERTAVDIKLSVVDLDDEPTSHFPVEVPYAEVNGEVL